MTTKAWNDLPNAAHIDWVLDTLKKDLEMWGIAGDAARGATLDAAWGDAWGAARGSGWGVAWDAARDDAWAAARVAVWGAIAALIAWGISGELLDKSVEEVTELAKAGDYDAVLMLPAVIVRNKLKEKKWQIEMANRFAKSDRAKDRFPNYESICLKCGVTIYKPYKELTDEEISAVWVSKATFKYDGEHFVDYIEFARDLLRKAQEK